MTLAGLSAQAQIPELVRQGKKTQLTHGGKPFIMLGGELANSSASSSSYMDGRDTWKYLAESGVNTVLAPVYWELIEPEEGRFDFTSVDYLLKSARSNGQKLVLLWFGTWKNSMSCYVPAWVKHGFGKEFDIGGNGFFEEELTIFCRLESFFTGIPDVFNNLFHRQLRFGRTGM